MDALSRRKKWVWQAGLLGLALLALAGLTACTLGGSAIPEDPAKADASVVDHPLVDVAPVSGVAGVVACEQPCGLTPDICLAGDGRGGCVVFCLDMAGPTGRPMAADCYDGGDPAGWCVDLNNDHVCDAGVGAPAGANCVDATLANIPAEASGEHRPLCSTDGNPPFGCPAGFTCDANGGGTHVCRSPVCGPTATPLLHTPQPQASQPGPSSNPTQPPVEQPTATATVAPTEVSTEETLSCYCENNADNSGWDGNYVCTKADGTQLPPEFNTNQCPLPDDNGGGNNGGNSGGPVCGNGKVEPGEQCEADKQCGPNGKCSACKCK